MNVLRWGRRLIGRVVCLLIIGAACLPVIGCGRKGGTAQEEGMPPEAKALRDQTQEEGMRKAKEAQRQRESRGRPGGGAPGG